MVVRFEENNFSIALHCALKARARIDIKKNREKKKQKVWWRQQQKQLKKIQQAVQHLSLMEPSSPNEQKKTSGLNTHERLTSIIIPTFNNVLLLRTCIQSIVQHTHDLTPYEMIVVDNGSTDETKAYCEEKAIKYVYLPLNMGFAKACNAGLRIAKGDQLCLLNNDVIVTPNWLLNLTIALQSAANVGIVGPVANVAGKSQRMTIPFSNITEFLHLAQQHNVSSSESWEETNRLIGMCFLFKRSVLDEVGFLDERYTLGQYEDDDYCVRTLLHGFRLLICRDVLVYHKGHATFYDKEQRRNLLIQNRFRFIEKWNEYLFGDHKA